MDGGFAPVRSGWRAPLRPVPPPPAGFRRFAAADLPVLGALMWDAYRGTPDEDDVGGPDGALRELRLTLAGEYGPFLPDASYVAEPDGRPVAAALVTVYRDEPLLAFLFTAPPHTGRGLGRELILAVMHALAEQGHDTLTLAVTRRNRRARLLYHRLGFVEIH
ncbi:GNAT family N-acetyltransferase [Actinomadura sp. CNU-125]|uniref:GNAT family N-acetyltransferase n=1 Tax=Actinomadura sp. CNU-125 TaxID=1904961 RepID=UPI00096A3EC6|nr:GNAT family N-acetyltransferase [Actinomadura sp. CNU-125]